MDISDFINVSSDAEENELAYNTLQQLEVSVISPASSSPKSPQRNKRSRSRSRSPSPTYQRSVPGRGVTMNRQTKKIKSHTKGSCFPEETRLAFLEHLNKKSSRSRLMTQARFDSIIRYLQEGLEGPVPERLTNAERAKYRRERKNALHDFYLGEDDGKLYRNSQNGSLEVVTFEKVIDVIDQHHASLAHSGVLKTFAYLSDRYYGVTLADVRFLLARCNFCGLTPPNSTRAPLRPVESSRPLERVQIDLVDLRLDSSEGQKWFLHMKDHFTKTSMLYPLQDKRSLEIALCLKEFMRYYGPPEIILCDNAKEFKGEIETLLKSRGVKIISGSLKAPRLQGLIEKANGNVKRKFTMWKMQNNRSDWEEGLELIERSINTSSCQGLPPKFTPHMALLGQKRRLELDFKLKTLELSMAEIDRIAMGL